jgi:hypothetical protein
LTYFCSHSFSEYLADFKYTFDERTSTWSLNAYNHKPDNPSSAEPQPKPFFSASFSPIPLLSSLKIPSDSRLLGQLYVIYQPPFPAATDPDDDASRRAEEHGEVASGASEALAQEWAILLPVIKGKSWIGKVRSTLDVRNGNEDEKEKGVVPLVGDGVGFPAVVPYGIGVCCEDLTHNFGLPEWFGDLNDIKPRLEAEIVRDEARPGD